MNVLKKIWLFVFMEEKILIPSEFDLNEELNTTL